MKKDTIKVFRINDTWLYRGVPGIAKLFEYLHKHYCKLNLADLINPAIELAEHGHRANWAIEKYSQQQLKRINKYAETRRAFTKEDDDYIHDGIGLNLQK